MAMIETINLTKKYGDLVALDNLNLTIDAGECFGFIGPNGAGKTTTIKILATLLKPTWGEARVDGHVVGLSEPSDPTDHRLRPRFPRRLRRHARTVEYLEFFAACYGIARRRRERRSWATSSISRIWATRPEPRMSTVSAVACSSASRWPASSSTTPRSCLMDEPASGLDPRARIEIRELLKELRRMGKTIIISSSHILHELSELCNAVGDHRKGPAPVQWIRRGDHAPSR